MDWRQITVRFATILLWLFATPVLFGFVQWFVWERTWIGRLVGLTGLCGWVLASRWFLRDFVKTYEPPLPEFHIDIYLLLMTAAMSLLWPIGEARPRFEDWLNEWLDYRWIVALLVTALYMLWQVAKAERATPRKDDDECRELSGQPGESSAGAQKEGPNSDGQA